MFSKFIVNLDNQNYEIVQYILNRVNDVFHPYK